MAKSSTKKKAAPKPKKVRAPKKVAGAFVATLTVNEEVFTGTGDTALDALDKICAEFPKMHFKTEGQMLLVKDKMQATQRFYVVQLRRLLNNKTMRIIWAKRLESMLK